MQSISIPNSLARIVKFYEKDSPHVPQELFSSETKIPSLEDFPYPLPSEKDEYTCSVSAGSVLWLGAKTGLTRYAPDAVRKADIIMYFSADRELADNNVRALYAEQKDYESIWVLTDTAVSHIELKLISAEEKAEILTHETIQHVARHGMVTQRTLTVPRVKESRVPHGHSDNSGCFTAGFAIGELCKYAVYKRTLGENNAKTEAAKKSAVNAVEACQLLMYISGRGDGFVARTYLVASEPVPDDGLFYRKENGKAVCLRTTASIKRNMAGMVIDASAPVPERLAHLYRDEGHSDNGIVYKGDTSSDEITLHFLLMYFAHEILGEEDRELDEIIKTSAKNTLGHILSHGNELYECDGKSTTWAKWSENYFKSVIGWSDGCLNAAELLMYHKVVMHITGEEGKWKESYDNLIKEHGYAKLTTLHDARFFISALMCNSEQVEELMYGDNMLATAAYWMLITLEDDPCLKEMYREGYKGWDGTFRREHNPAYDIPYMLSVPDAKVDTGRLSDWFRRTHITRLASGVSLTSRHDVPMRIRHGGLKETSCLLMPDELSISKYDRNPHDYKNSEGGLCTLESCYVYTFAYWLGRYYGFIQ